MVLSIPFGFGGHQTFGRRGLTWAVGFSILLHVAFVWYFVSRLVMERTIAETPTPIIVEPLIVPRVEPPPPPELKTDPPQAPSKPREALPAPEAAEVPPLPMPPQPAETIIEPTAEIPAQTLPPAAPRPVKRVDPRYPDRAADDGIEGDAIVQLTIAADGSVVDAALVSETPANRGFGSAAVKAVGKWEFGAGQAGTYRVTVRFRLDS